MYTNSEDGIYAKKPRGSKRKIEHDLRVSGKSYHSQSGKGTLPKKKSNIQWLDTVAVLVLIGNMVTSAPAPAPQTSLFYRQVALPHGVAAKQLSGQSDPESMWPNGVFLPPDDEMQAVLQLQHIGNGNGELDDDPLLVTGTDAVNIVTLLLSHGELFFNEIPHARALLRYEQGRIDNGLSPDLLGSSRPESPFYRWIRRDKIQRQRRIMSFL